MSSAENDDNLHQLYAVNYIGYKFSTTKTRMCYT